MVDDTRSAPDADEHTLAFALVLQAARKYSGEMMYGLSRRDRYYTYQEIRNACDIVERTASSAGPTQEQPRCEKCGSTDIFTRWRQKGEKLSPTYDNREHHNAYREYADRECLYRHCRGCDWWWTDDIGYRRIPDSPAAQPQVGAQQSSDEAPVA